MILGCHANESYCSGWPGHSEDPRKNYLYFLTAQNNLRMNEIITGDQCMIPFCLRNCIACVINYQSRRILVLHTQNINTFSQMKYAIEYYISFYII